MPRRWRRRVGDDRTVWLSTETRRHVVDLGDKIFSDCVADNSFAHDIGLAGQLLAAVDADAGENFGLILGLALLEPAPLGKNDDKVEERFNCRQNVFPSSAESSDPEPSGSAFNNARVAIETAGLRRVWSFGSGFEGTFAFFIA